MIIRTLLAFCIAMLFAGSSFAQLASQTAIVGTVTDPSGSVVPGATVVAVNIGTRDTYESITNAQGQYTMSFMRRHVRCDRHPH